MKVKNLNRSSLKTKNLIRKTFAEMLHEKLEMDKISVSELCDRADISRASFYCHYDDIYAVAEDFENQLIANFFTNTKLLEAHNYQKFVDELFAYIYENNQVYKLLCSANAFVFMAERLTTLVINKLIELSNNDSYLKNRELITIQLSIFVNGLLFEYVKYCRGTSLVTPEELYAYTSKWMENFVAQRS